MDNPKRGRPTKGAIEKAKKNPVGRPKGDNYAIAEFKARIMNSPKSRKVFDAVLDAALDENHKNQAAAWKLLFDRMLPMSYFEKDKLGGSRPSVNIVISGVGESVTIDSEGEDVTDVEDVYDAEN